MCLRNRIFSLRYGFPLVLFRGPLYLFHVHGGKFSSGHMFGIRKILCFIIML